MNRVAELTLKLLDRALTSAEAEELDALAADPRAEAEHLELLALEAELRALRTDFDLADATLAQIQEAQAERTAGAVLAAITTAAPPIWARSGPGPRRTVRRRAVAVVLTACAACALVAVWLGVKPAPIVLPAHDDLPGAAGQGFAKLSQKTGLVEVLNATGDVVPVEEGNELPVGFTLRTGDESLAVVELLAEPARFEIESDSVVRFRSGGRTVASKPQLYLAAGQLTATVSDRPNSRPLVVSTSVTDVLAHSGLFVVSSAGPDTARVDIRSGQVELVRTVAPKPVPVGVGSALVTAGLDRVDIENSRAVDRVPARTLAFPGARDVTYSLDGAELWVGNARAFTRWGETSAIESSYYARRTDGFAGFTRDRKHLVTFRGDREDRVLIRSLPDGGELAVVDARIGDSRFWAVGPDASWFAVVDLPKPHKCVRLLDVATGEERFQLNVAENIACITSSPDGRALAVGLIDLARGGSNKVLLLDTITGARLSSLPIQKRPPTALAYSDDGRLLAVGFNGVIQIWDVASRELLRTITGFERAVVCLAFSPDANRIAAGTPDGSVWVWHRASGLQTQLIESGGRGVRTVAFSPNGKHLATVANGAPVAVWDIKLTGDLQ
ncbi:WD domain, G-beta repeat [Gemmata obscuriglobus]|uniref:Uncharacterized protein n=1 Tax=Gemmata obscuriglobus TaxID=114 RepID=A0A2Z3GXC7_9BACT|nr:serine/threonine protein kinase [Gemmata obscuriglobus]AWM38048.1 hypothetical protein C1280_14305 [Gemmata obscuriglobus]QEG29079.1 WD domain, G-beta repeat [Gemmata obscuriglobus]VTS07733.1 serine threonine protein kinase with wd40 repeats : Similar to prolyl oligopeptidase OS=Botryotinia fuckeliana (strain T4) GN=BofuT4_P098240.1 PE=4 SV=1: WD40 [Gemmata obscuriglobus UQM 2246]